jgi:hypothetical protein
METSKDGTTPIAFPSWVRVTKCQTRTYSHVFPRHPDPGYVGSHGAVKLLGTESVNTNAE